MIRQEKHPINAQSLWQRTPINLIRMKPKPILFLALATAILAAAILLLQKRQSQEGLTGIVQPTGIMGTTCKIVAVAPQNPDKRAGAAAPNLNQTLARAEAELRRVEARMSAWLANSEISRFNSAPSGREIPLSTATLQVLQAARAAHGSTQGAFDPTIGPLIELWKKAGRENALPTETALAQARAQSNWNQMDLTQTGLQKRSAEVRLDLGGIAKGYAIDRALGVLQSAGLAAGLVDVGGDLACFGSPDTPETGWEVDLQNPFGEGILGTLLVPAGAVCTSGNYARFQTIQGHHYSHIVDPRTARPAEAVPSATVIAPTAMQADIWATALCVLGPEGMKHLPESVEAILVLGNAANHEIICTKGMLPMLGANLRQKTKVSDFQPQPIY